MKNSICLFLFFCGTVVFGQRTNIDAKIIFNDGHVENSKVAFIVNLFDSTLLDEKSITQKKITIVPPDNKKIKLLSADIQAIDFTDLKGVERHFVKMPDYKYLVELKYDGKIKWYKIYTENVYDYSTTVQDYLYVGKTSYFFSILKNNRKRLKEFFSDRTDLHPFIDKINYNRLNDDDLYSLLKKYDE